MNHDPPKHLEEDLRPIWVDLAAQVKPHTPPSALEAMARQMWLMRDAGHRIREEGAIVVDAKGNAGEHPAIRIQRDASTELQKWLAKYARHGL